MLQKLLIITNKMKGCIVSVTDQTVMHNYKLTAKSIATI